MKNKPIIEQDLLALIPHRSPFLMVGRLISASEDEFVTEFEVTKDNILLRDGLFLESGMIENIAQSAALGFGYNGMKSGKKPGIGYIGAVSRVNVYQLPGIGDLITTHVRITHRLDPVVMVNGKVSLNEKVLLEGEIKLVI